MKKHAILLAAWAILLLGACRTLPADAGAVAGPSPTQAITNTNTPVLEEETADPLPLPSATPTIAPVRFVFPTPGLMPESAWRPPLYEVPWAPTQNDHFFFIRPIAANEVNWADGTYRYGGIFFENVIHSGIDIAASEGTPIMAAGPGKVIWAGYGLFSGSESADDPYGLAVAIRHTFGYDGKTLYTVYAHMSEVHVLRGQSVDTGQVIGLVGRTGFATGFHLHFEVRLGENDFFTTYNPELWIAPPQGWGLLAGRIMGSGGQILIHQELTITNLESGRIWETVTYGDPLAVNADPYYRENFVVGDLPAGKYEVATPYLGRINRIQFEIFPGKVTYFIYQGREGFKFGPPDSLRPTPIPSGTP